MNQLVESGKVEQWLAERMQKQSDELYADEDLQYIVETAVKCATFVSLEDSMKLIHSVGNKDSALNRVMNNDTGQEEAVRFKPK